MRVRGRRVLAVLAGGVVLLGGGVTTLAAWQDTEYAQLPLTLSSFNIESSLDGDTWSDAEQSTSPNNLVVAVNGALQNVKLTPSGVVTGWVGLRAAAGSMPATVTMTALAVRTGTNGQTLLSTVVGPNQTPAVTYEAVSGVGRTACQAGDFTNTTSMVPSGSVLGGTITSSSSTFGLAAGTNGQPGQEVGVCFRLKLASDLSHALGGASITPVWKFDARSAEQ